MTDEEEPKPEGTSTDEPTPWELDDGSQTDLAAGTGADPADDAEDGRLTDGPHDHLEPQQRFRIPAFGEIVSKRHPILIALVMVFALFLAVAPLLFRYERNSLHEAVVVYTRICEARENGRMTDDWLKSVSGPALLSMSSTDRMAFVDGMECQSAKTHAFALRLVEGRALGPNRAYVLSVFKGSSVKKVEKAGGHVANFFFPVIGDRLVIDVMPAGGQLER